MNKIPKKLPVIPGNQRNTNDYTPIACCLPDWVSPIIDYFALERPVINKGGEVKIQEFYLESTVGINYFSQRFNQLCGFMSGINKIPNEWINDEEFISYQLEGRVKVYRNHQNFPGYVNLIIRKPPYAIKMTALADNYTMQTTPEYDITTPLTFHCREEDIAGNTLKQVTFRVTHNPELTTEAQAFMLYGSKLFKASITAFWTDRNFAENGSECIEWVEQVYNELNLGKAGDFDASIT